MSQSSQVSTREAGTDGPTTFHLFKISYATNPRLYGNLLWTHVKHRDDLFLVFDDVITRNPNGLVSRRRCIKLVIGGDVLERINIEDLMNQTRLDEDRTRSQTIPDAELNFVMIVKSPLIAMRYRLPGGQVRRIQTAFKFASDYDVAVKTYASFGLPIRYKDGSVEYLQPMQPKISYALPSAIASSSQQLGYHNQQVSCTSGYTPIPSHQQPYLDSSRSQLGQSFASKSSGSQAAVVSIVTPASTSSSSSFSAPKTVLPEIGTKSGLELSRPPLLLGGIKPNSPPRSLLTDQPEVFPIDIVPSRTHTSDGLLGEPTRRLLFTQELCARPSSAPEPSQSDSITQMLPPKRTLPFPDRPAKRILNKNVEFEGTIEPTPKKSRKKPSATLSKATSKKQSAFKVPEIPNHAAKVGLSKTIGSALSNALEPITLPSKPTASKPRTRTQKSKDISPEVPAEENFAAKVALEKSARQVGIAEEGEEEISEEYQNGVDAFIKKYVAPEESALEKFVKLPEEQRAIQADALIREYIFDDNFVTLCEELEKSCQRLGVVF